MLSQGGQFISETSQPACSDRKNLSSETGFHEKMSCLPDNEYYDYTDHNKAKNQDTDLLTGFFLIREEKKKKKATDTRNT